MTKQNDHNKVMTESIGSPPKTASLNTEFFSHIGEKKFGEGAPHLKHQELTSRLLDKARHAFEQVRQTGNNPEVLDMGAGTGLLSLPLLEMGASVMAADATQALLDILVSRAGNFKSRLTPVAGDIFETLESCQKSGRRFDLICASSFLHHIPDYLKLCRMAASLLKLDGVIFTLQDPLRYDTLPKTTYLFDRTSYFTWRLFQGNYIRGFKTRLRRLAGIYRTDLMEDVVEYHVVREGVDQDAIRQLFEMEGFHCEIQKYWSTQSTFFQHLGTRLGLLNTFALIATRRQDR